MSGELSVLDKAVALTNLATRIRTEHEAATASLKRGIEHALAAGELLIEAKGQLRHGEWLPWLRDHCRVSERSARRYMQLANRRTELEAKSATVADLTINGALQALSPPEPLPVNEKVVDAIVEAFQAVELLRRLSDAHASVEKLAEDICTQGQLVPVEVDKDGRVVEGQAYYEACEKLNIEPITISYSGDDPLGSLIRNGHNQKLTEEQRIELAKKLSALLTPEELRPHPFNELFPVDEKTVDLLAEDIRTQGQLHPIVLYQGRILDGKLRYLACKKLGIKPTVTRYKGDNPLGFVVSMNFHRQGLSEDQRAMALVEIEALSSQPRPPHQHGEPRGRY